MRIAVTGAAGYLGQAVLARLHRDGHEVTAIGHRTPVDRPPGVFVRYADLTDAAAATEAIAGADAVCHLAGRTRVRDSGGAVGRYYRDNLVATLNLLDAMTAGNRPARLVFLSSGAVYGRSGREPIAESHPTEPRSAYGATKLAAEQAISWYAAAGGLSAVSLRLFNAAGAVRPGSGPDGSTLIARALAVATGEETTLPINGDGTAVRDFVHVADVADAIALALSLPCRGAEVFNLGAVGASVLEVVSAVERVVGTSVPVEHKPANGADQPWLLADTSAARERLGWRPERSTLESMIADQWKSGSARG
ncbi:NAD-dependent epimerase/dehydratase family protein [Saccharopolyspora hirsuta]|nr:NAD-dependent epimerase/dehydratase family protein [Saccharopolyspora hirsuta]